jgi:hypothetical protein
MVHYKGCLGVTSKPIVGTHTGTTPFCGIFGDIIFGYWVSTSNDISVCILTIYLSTDSHSHCFVFVIDAIGML